MSIPAKPLTIRSLASRLRLSAMTVSRALRNAPGVSDATRKLVVEAARNRGYRPDPSLAVLNAYRNGKRHLLPHETVAYLTNFPTADEWRQIGTFQRYFNGAQARATELGYTLEHFWLGDPRLTERRASQILLNRGVRGLIVGPLDRSGSSLEMDWEQFTAVALGRSLLAPLLTTVSTHHFQSVEVAWQKAWTRGYRRIGLVLTEEEDARTVGTLHASYLLQQTRHGATALPVMIAPAFSAPALEKWTEKHSPDVILSSNHRDFELLLASLGPAVQGKLFLNLNVNPRSEMCGVDQGHEKAGEHAMTALHLKLIRRETGIPARRELILIDSVWKEGRGAWQLPRRAALATAGA